jgi:hypothetical protein
MKFFCIHSPHFTLGGGMFLYKPICRMECNLDFLRVIFGTSHIIFQVFLEKNKVKISYPLNLAVLYTSKGATLSEKTAQEQGLPIRAFSM